MVKSRKELEKELTRQFTSFIADKKQLQRWIKEARDNYDMPETVSSDYLGLRKDISEADTFALFILSDVVGGINLLQTYFSKQEIKELSKEKWYVEKIKWPLKYHMTKITDTQFIGHISVKELMKLRDAQLINYNENVQRTMKHIVRGETEYYQIALNKEAVYGIMESFDNNLYIPNTITLNLPEDAAYDYDEEHGILSIKKIEFFDIIDGYHRYVGMSKIYNQDPDFDYDMELRIVQFPEGKAKRFIWQEDQKTRMRKIDSDSMDTSKLSNRIVERLNSDPAFIFMGKISRNKGMINTAELTNIIDIMFLKGIKKSEEFKQIRIITDELLDGIEYIIDNNPEMETRPWNKKELLVLCYEIKNDTLDDFAKDYQKVKDDNTIYAQASLSQADITRVSKLLGKEI